MGRFGHDRYAASSFRRGGMVRAVRRLLAVVMIAGTALPAASSPALADCAPLARPAGFRAVQEAERRDYDAIEFTVQRDGGPATETIAGTKCYQVYVAEDAATAPAASELLARYGDRLAATGAQILFTDRQRIHARLTRAGSETWFRVGVQDNEVDVTVLQRRPLTPTLTRPSGRDHRLIGHMPHYRDVAVDQRADATEQFTVQDRDDGRTVDVRGAVHAITYQAESRGRLSSDAEIQENYRIALRARGADILFTDWRTTVARIADRRRVIWVRVTSQVSEIMVLTVEAELPPPGKRLSDTALRRALEQDGRATVASGLGVGTSALADIDRGIVRQVARLLRRDRALALAVVVHTDDVGDPDANRRRSQALAEAIVAAVVKQRIAPGRITAVGAGPDRPVADNATVEGRAANRRIELVRSAEPSPSPSRP